MMDLVLPGRDTEGPEDYEAQHALRTLAEAETIKDSDDEKLLKRIGEEVEYNIEILTRVQNLIGSLRSEPGSIEDRLKSIRGV